MARDSYIVRFKVVTVKCASMPAGNQYTLFYRRGDISRSTPCYTAAGDGTVNFSSMPEGSAVVHFKSGKAGRRFAPKYIQFRIEEYTRGSPRRPVGECEVDCTLVMDSYNSGGNSGVVRTNFRMYGAQATMSVAILVYPRDAPPLSFEGLIDPALLQAPTGEGAAAAAAAKGEVKTMARGEAMTLLISLETLLERRRAEEANSGGGGGGPRLTKAEKRVRELEERRRQLTGSQGLATAVVKSRCEGAVHAQFVALARKCRNNYIGETAAYLRQMALSCGAPLGGDDDEDEAAAAAAAGGDTAREQLQRCDTRIGELRRQTAKLEEEQMALGRLQHKTDVTAELCANLEKVAVLDAQIKTLEATKAALEAALRRGAADASSPLSREVREMKERVAACGAEQQQLAAKVDHMTSVAAAHVLAWARGKNPIEPEAPKESMEDLFKDYAQPGGGGDLPEDQRRQLLGALAGIKAKPKAAGKAAAAASSSSSSSSTSGHNTPRDLFSGQEGLPSMGDFGSAKPKHEAHVDPARPADLGAGMFTAAPAKPRPTATATAPPVAASPASDAVPMFDFGAILQATEPTGASSPSSNPGFSLEPTVAPGPPPAAAAAAATATIEDKRKDDPYYDEMDDFTVPAEVAGAASVEVTGGGGFSFEPSSPGPQQSVQQGGSSSPTASSSAAAARPAPRPTFDFGPSDTGGGGAELSFGGGGGGFTGGFSEGAPAFTFEDTNTAENDPKPSAAYSNIPNLPSYSFGS